MIDPDTKLTPHFTLREMTASKSHPETYNVPPFDAVENLMNVCQWLEKLRDAYNRRYAQEEEPIVVSSGYRSKMLNYAVGGVKDSNHLTGCAADIRCRDGEQAMRYATLLIDLFREAGRQWDEIIVEKKRSTRFWLHFAVKPETNRYTPNRCKVTVIELK